MRGGVPNLLSVSSWLTSLQARVSYDLLEHHHTTNRHRHSPSPNSLAGTGDSQDFQSSKRQCLEPPEQLEEDVIDPKGDSTKDQLHHGRYSRNAKGTDVVGGQCWEVLMEVIAHFEAQGWEVEAGKVSFPVKKKANDLLNTARYLRGEPDGQGRASNFAHRALKNICLAFYYSNSSKCLHQFTEFQEYVPYRALALVAAMVSHRLKLDSFPMVLQVHALLSSFRKHGIDNSAQVNSLDVDEAYTALNETILDVLDHPHHGPKLNALLTDWAQSGMYVSVRIDY
ncbi:hypothetical protein BKA83DRAFT_101775 [Pisolithus microcarpus]|nr:hypothetical protein BKA83DRAFT_101775 [Pisolithus microcarpus]